MEGMGTGGGCQALGSRCRTWAECEEAKCASGLHPRIRITASCVQNLSRPYLGLCCVLCVVGCGLCRGIVCVSVSCVCVSTSHVVSISAAVFLVARTPRSHALSLDHFIHSVSLYRTKPISILHSFQCVNANARRLFGQLLGSGR